MAGEQCKTRRLKSRLRACGPPPLAAGGTAKNAALGSPGLPLYLLDLRHAPAGAVSQWLAGPYVFHKVSEVYYTDNPGYDDVTVSLGTYFDVVLHVQKITPSQLFPSQQA